ncbi:single-stranded DNA-binding protein [Mucilaginibacter auburnensis]|uniref:Single-stranded DNA-binding protein n=1 Tax=Mucilaginibacter auburnensis TaxID=1457233 RepID=A0A2H9VML4_9SPHI|nr:single-stranded DNA-binding protein [Mucilaginibacter auburnensis]PJJ79553.1 single-strand DNA-binding protein [Mucilaginibacter auburnensis]
MLSQSTINKVLLLGKIMNEPVWSQDSGEKALCFTIATTEKVKKNAEHVLHEEYHDIRLGSHLANDLQLRRGELVYIQGKIQTRQFVDEEQIRRYKTEIVALSVDIITAPQAEPQLSQAHRF